MNGKEALYDIAVTCDGYGFEPTVPSEFDNDKNHHFAHLFKEQFAIIEKELDAFYRLLKYIYLGRFYEIVIRTKCGDYSISNKELYNKLEGIIK